LIAVATNAKGFGTLNWSVLVGYLLAILLMGVYFSRREKSTNDFFLAGRRIPWWAAGLSIVGTGLSAITFMAVPGKAYAGDWTHAVGNLVPILLIPIVIYFYLPFYRRLNVTTAYEYLEKRFNPAARMIGGLLYIAFQFLRMAVILYLPALALHTVAGLDIFACILAMGLLCTLYTVLGGVEAVIWTDVLQVVVLTGAAVVCLVIISSEVDGGFGGVISAGMDADKFKLANLTWDPKAGALWLLVVWRFFGDFMPNTADQGVIQRYLTVRDLKSARRAAWVGGLSAIPATLIFFGLGTALWVFYQAHPGQVPKGTGNDQILPLFMVQKMPEGVAGLAIAGLFAAAMSSVDSSMNSVSAVVTTDVYRRFRPRADERSCLLVARWVTGVTGLVGTAAALLLGVYGKDIKSMWDFFLYVMFWMGSPLAGMFVLGIFTRRANGIGACLGAVLGAAGILAVMMLTKLSGLLYPVIGLIGCVVTGYVVSIVFSSGRRDLAGLTIHTPGDNSST